MPTVRLTLMNDDEEPTYIHCDSFWLDIGTVSFRNARVDDDEKAYQNLIIPLHRIAMMVEE